jgi:two-component system response regulator YesN
MNALRLLTVDDEPHVHEGLDALMDWAELGYEHVGSALNGVEGLEIAKKKRPDVILTDIRMPGMDGLALIEAIRGIPEYEPAIIIVSGYDEFEYAQTAIRQKVGDYILKPMDEDELARLLTRIRVQRQEAQEVPAVRDPGSAGVDNSVVRALLSQAPTSELLQAAEQLRIVSVHGVASAILIPIDREEGHLAFPLSLTDLRTALSASTARASREWIYREAPRAFGILLRVGRHQTRPDQFSLWVKGLQKSLAEYLGREIFLIVGPQTDRVDDAWRSRRTILSRLEEHHMVDTPGFAILDGSAAPLEPLSRTDYSGSALMARIEALDRTLVDDEITSEFMTFRRDRTASSALRDWLDEVRLQTNRLVTELGGTESSASSRLVGCARYAEFTPLTVMEDTVRAFVSESITEIDARRRISRHGVVALMLRRIEHQYSSDLSVSAMASEFQMNANYLGQQFRGATGKGFKDSLRERRVEEACRLLRDTDLRIPDISTAVGYRDVDYFTDQFKRERQTTPAAYRATIRGRT